MNGKELRRLMKKYGLTVEMLAEEIGVSGRQIYYLLADEKPNYNWKPLRIFFRSKGETK